MRYKRPHGLMGILALAAIGLAGCSAAQDPPVQGLDQQWFDAVFDDGKTDIKQFPRGGGILGTAYTANEIPGGWYSVDLACNGKKEATFTISQDDSTLGEGTIPCGDSGFTTTTMDLPAGSISSTAVSGDPNTMWQVRFRPSTQPGA